MQASIGMFVMGITMTQTFGVMEQMVGKGTELGNVFKDMGMGVRFMLGPIQVVTSAMQFLNMANKAMMLTMLNTMGIMAGMFLLWKAFTTESKALRFALGLLSGILITYNAILLITKARIWAVTHAEIINKSVASLGGALPLLAVAIAGGTALGLAAAATAPKGQTTDGYIRPVRKTGLFYAHAGEGVGQIGAMSPFGAGGSGPSIEINNFIQTDVDDNTISRLADETEMAAVRGMETAFKTAQWGG